MDIKRFKEAASGNTNLRDLWYSNPQVLAERIMQKNVLTCSITIPNSYKEDNNDIIVSTRTFPFFLDSDFGFSLNNEWQKLHSGLENLPALQGFANMMSAVNSQAQVTFQSQSMSSLSWNGSTFSGFDLSCLFLCTNRRINPVVAINELSRACLPVRLEDYAGDKPVVLDKGQQWANMAVDGIAGMLNNVVKDEHKKAVSEAAQTAHNFVNDVGLVAPLGYGIMLNSGEGHALQPIPGTTLSFQIGDWFRATDLVVESISSVQFSKELIAPAINEPSGKNDLYKPKSYNNDYGFPLYAKCNIRLKPYTLVDYHTFNGYFIQRMSEDINKIANIHNRFTLPN